MRGAGRGQAVGRAGYGRLGVISDVVDQNRVRGGGIPGGWGWIFRGGRGGAGGWGGQSAAGWW